ncbi:MAG: hypothetical protein K5679_11680 [Lachnospiraceae bacterium]|nr:hypothetical protein [Lachnospiraceae bacterium]
MVKLKDIVWGDVDLGEESLLPNDNSSDTEGKGEVIVMCCGGGGGGGSIPGNIIIVACPRICPFV